MGPAVLGAEVAPDGVPGARRARLVGMGNPHVVVLGEPVDDAVVSAMGPRLEALHPDGANVEFAWPGPGAWALSLRVWERGVGETLACGTGACAVVAAARSWGEVGTTARVHSAGGVLEVTVSDDGIVLAGPTRLVGAVTVDESVLAAMVGALRAEGVVGAPRAEGVIVAVDDEVVAHP
jgi:diaminopimelate epimerase